MSQNTRRKSGPSDRYFSRVGAVFAIVGVVIYFASAMLHPGTPPHHTEAAFAHYAQEPLWGIIHLGELLGVLFMAGAGIALTWRLRSGDAGVWAILGGAAMIAFAVVQAQTGFSETSMAFQAGLYIGVVWILAVGLFLFRSPAREV